jgi:ribose 5-phosphate isomerase A
VGTASSEASTELARSVGIRLVELDDLPSLDVNLDGADEVDPQFRMIKGRGGALLREKIVASAARQRVIVVIADKLVPRLATKAPVPVEASNFGLTHIERRLRELGATASIRLQPNGSRFSTDGGNAIIDCSFPPIDDVDALDRSLRQVVGVFETGLFLGLCDLLVVGHADGVEKLERASAGLAPTGAP